MKRTGKLRTTCVILAAGDFPKRGGLAWQALERATVVVCCDHAADAYRRRFHTEPTVVVGDCDSVKGRFAETVKIAEQETNDLEKAIRHCRERGWTNPLIIGATGKREDHAIGNVFRALAHRLDILTDYGRFHAVDAKAVFRVKEGTPISIFAPNPRTRMTSTGLEWPLDGVRFENLYCATLNRASASRVALTTTEPVYVYIAQ